jgi:hypothetical protein
MTEAFRRAAKLLLGILLFSGLAVAGPHQRAQAQSPSSLQTITSDTYQFEVPASWAKVDEPLSLNSLNGPIRVERWRSPDRAQELRVYIDSLAGSGADNALQYLQNDYAKDAGDPDYRDFRLLTPPSRFPIPNTDDAALGGFSFTDDDGVRQDVFNAVASQNGFMYELILLPTDDYAATNEQLVKAIVTSFQPRPGR